MNGSLVVYMYIGERETQKENGWNVTGREHHIGKAAPDGISIKNSRRNRSDQPDKRTTEVAEKTTLEQPWQQRKGPPKWQKRPFRKDLPQERSEASLKMKGNRKTKFQGQITLAWQKEAA